MLKKIKRVVVKVGSQLLSGEDGLNIPFIEKIAEQISNLSSSGKEIVLVSSGAVLAGIKALNLQRKPFSLQEKQALSAIGQPYLMAEYRKAFKKLGKEVAQVLLTAEDLRSKERFFNAKNTLNSLMRFKVIPIINENDTLSTQEIKIGDNDNLSAHVSVLFDADLLVILTITNGLYDKDPNKSKNARLIPVVENAEKLKEICDFKGKSCFGTGGMGTKVEAATKASKKGIPVIIAGGNEEKVLERIIARGEKVGTLFLPAGKLKAKAYRIFYLEKVKGKVFIDSGAVKAITENGKSLLPKGIKRIEGNFKKGDTVEIFDTEGNLIGKGLARCSAEEIKNFTKTFIHRDDMVILKEG